MEQSPFAPISQSRDCLLYTSLRGLISLFPEQDSVRAFLNDDSGSVYTITSNAPFDEETYVAFKSSLFADVPVSITFEITKGFKDGYLSVYCFEKFVNDILSLSLSLIHI